MAEIISSAICITDPPVKIKENITPRIIVIKKAITGSGILIFLFIFSSILKILFLNNKKSVVKIKKTRKLFSNVFYKSAAPGRRLITAF